MTQITINQWLTAQITPNTGTSMPATRTSLPRYQIVASKRFYGHYDVLDTHTGNREACGNLRTARATVASKSVSVDNSLVEGKGQWVNKTTGQALSK